MSLPLQAGAVAEDEEALAALGGRLPGWRLALARRLFGDRARRDFYDVFATYLDRGVREPEALAEIRAIERADCPAALRWSRPLATAIPHWLCRILDRGERLGAVLADWLPGDEAMILAALADAGLTGPGLRDLARLSGRRADGAASLRRALWPLLGASSLFVAGFWYLSNSLFPTLFAALPRGVALDGAAAGLKAASDLFAAYGPVLLAAVTLVPFAVARLLPLWTGRVRRAIDDLPLFGLYKSWTGLSFLLSLAALLTAGVALREALETLESRASPYVAERLRAVLIRDDAYLGDALAESGFRWPDPRTIKLIRHFILSDRPGEALAALAESSAQRLDARLRRLSTTLSYAVQIAVFAAIFWFLEATSQMSDLVQATTAS
jgi:hypothetical protein